MADNLNQVALIAQPEPLFTVRPRYAENLRRGDGRGVRASFKLVEKKSSKFRTSNSAISESIRKQLLGDKGTSPFTSFLITQMSYQFTEKIQLSQVFGDHTVAYAFGASPIILNITGVVTDDLDNDWFTKFIFLYKDYMRGTQLARNFELGRLSTNNATYDGAIMSLSMSHDSSNDALVTFNMQFLVRAFEFYSAQEYRADDLVSAEDLMDNALDSAFNAVSASSLKSLANDSKLAAAKADLELNLAGLTKNSGLGSFGEINSQFESVKAAATAAANKAVRAGTVHNAEEADRFSFASLTKGTVNGDQNSVLLENNSARITRSSGVKAGSSLTWLSKLFGNNSGGSATSSKESLNWKVVGMYSDGIKSFNSGVESIGGFLDELKRNLEAFNSRATNMPDPFSSLSDAIANVRKQANTIKDIVNLVKESSSILSRKRDIFAGVNAELAALQGSIRNLKGAVSSLSTTTPQKVAATLASTPFTEESLPFLGNSAIGVSSEDAIRILFAISSVEDSSPSILGQAPPTDRNSQLKAKAVNESLSIPSFDSIYSPTYTAADSSILVFV